MSAILQFDGIRRAFKRGVPVLDGVSFAMGPEEVVALLGRNGAGKTTLINIAMGLLFPHEGSVRVFGLSPTEHPVAVKRRIGFVGEQQTLPASATIAELIALHRTLFLTWDSALEKQLLARFAFDNVNAKIGKLSKGQAQQVALLCAVCHRPELLILDEPAAGLDPAARREFLETSIQLLNREGTAILFSSHHMGDVERLGGRVVLLDDGRVRLDADLDDLRERHCLAIVPRAAVLDAGQLERIAGCLRARVVNGAWHALFRGTALETQARLHEALGVRDVPCVTLPLEELFVALVGGKVLAGAA